MAFDLRTSALLILLASLGTLGVALAFQYVGGYEPCELCHWQRYPYVATALLAVAGLALVSRAPAWTMASLGVSVLVFLIGGGIAVFHVGVEEGWWQGTAACGAVGSRAATLEELRQQILARPVIRCDEPQWSLFGLTMAGYNVILSLAFAGFALIAVVHAVRRKP